LLAAPAGGYAGAVDSADAIRQRIRLVPGAGGTKRHLMHPFNGRFHPVDHAALEALVAAMASRVDVTRVDYVLGFPEGGSIPAYAFARAVNRPVILASRLPLDLPDRISFEQPAANLGTTHHVYGLRPGARVMIFEDELTNGHTALNAVRALRGARIEIDQIAALFAIDHPALWRRMREAGVTLHVGVTLPPAYAPRALDAE
jgi:adenine/guanine phosphoribosyltransferase-like PRPP-binding protein